MMAALTDEPVFGHGKKYRHVDAAVPSANEDQQRCAMEGQELPVSSLGLVSADTSSGSCPSAVPPRTDLRSLGAAPYSLTCQSLLDIEANDEKVGTDWV